MGVCYLLCSELHSHKRLEKKKNTSQERKKESLVARMRLCQAKGKHIFVGTEGRNWDHDLDFLFVFWMHDFSRSSFILPYACEMVVLYVATTMRFLELGIITPHKIAGGGEA